MNLAQMGLEAKNETRKVFRGRVMDIDDLVQMFRCSKCKHKMGLEKVAGVVIAVCENCGNKTFITDEKSDER